MPLSQRSTLTQFLIEERRRYPGASGDFNALILDVALACKAIAGTVAFGEFDPLDGSSNIDVNALDRQHGGRGAPHSAARRCFSVPA